MYNIPPNTHARTHTRKLSLPHKADHQHSRKHTRMHTHTAYYLYEVLYTSDHQHRVSLFSNPHSSWKECSMQWRDYTVGLIGVLIWVIVRALDCKNMCRKEYHLLLCDIVKCVTTAHFGHCIYCNDTSNLHVCVHSIFVWLIMSKTMNYYH